MSAKSLLGWVIASVAVSLAGLSRLGLTSEVPVHWMADGKPDLIAPSWSILLGTPILVLLLLALIQHARSTRLIANDRSRTAALVAASVIGSEGFLLLCNLQNSTVPIAWGIIVFGLLLATAGNFWAKDTSRQPAIRRLEGATAGSRDFGRWLFFAGIIIILCGAASGAVLSHL